MLRQVLPKGLVERKCGPPSLMTIQCVLNLVNFTSWNIFLECLELG
jgi:hypothetical protein